MSDLDNQIDNGGYSTPTTLSQNEKRCYVCSGLGHIAAECPSRFTPRSTSYQRNRQTHYSRSGIIYPGRVSPKFPVSARDQRGHITRQYRSQAFRDNPRNRRVGGYSAKRLYCLNCHREGHLVRNCPEPKICLRCGESGHIASECCNPVRCNRCLQAGHFAKDCPNALVCTICGQSGHKSGDCPSKL